MKDIPAFLDSAEASCKVQGERLTKKRKQILSIMLQFGKAVSAYELIEFYQANYRETLSPMSAYRILDFLASMHLVHKLNIANKYVACSHIGSEHCHDITHFLICEKCQKVDEIHSEKAHLSDLINTIKNTGYQLSSPQIELSCICNTCAQA